MFPIPLLHPLNPSHLTAFLLGHFHTGASQWHSGLGASNLHLWSGAGPVDGFHPPTLLTAWPSVVTDVFLPVPLPSSPATPPLALVLRSVSHCLEVAKGKGSISFPFVTTVT